MTDGNPNGWGEYRRMILDRLEMNNQSLNTLTSQLNRLHIEIATLKTKVLWLGGIAGAVGGSVLSQVVAMMLARLTGG